MYLIVYTHHQRWNEMTPLNTHQASDVCSGLLERAPPLEGVGDADVPLTETTSLGRKWVWVPTVMHTISHESPFGVKIIIVTAMC